MKYTSMLAIFIGLGAVSSAQPSAPPAAAVADPDPIRDYVEARLRGQPLGPVEAYIFAPDLLASRVISRMRATENPLARDFAVRRSDLQAGAGSGVSGSTSLVGRAGLPEWFTAAIENGAFAKQNDGTATTVRVSALGLYRSFGHDGCAIGTSCYDQFWGKGLEFHTTYDPGASKTVVPLTTSQGGQTQSNLLGAINPGGRISQAGLKWEFLHSLDVAHNKAKLDAWHKALPSLQQSAGTLATSLASVTDASSVQGLLKKFKSEFKTRMDPLFHTPEAAGFTGLATSAQAAMIGNLTAKAHTANEEAFNVAFTTFTPEAGLDGDIQAFQSALRSYNTQREVVLGAILYESKGAFEFNYLNPASTPNLFTFTLLWTTPLGGVKNLPPTGTQLTDAQKAAVDAANAAGPRGTLSVNLGGSIFETFPTGTSVGRFRHFQGSVQLDRKVGPVAWEKPPTLSFAGYYQYMAQNGVIEFKQDQLVPNTNIPLPRPAIEILNTTGSIGIVQAKLSIPIGKTGIELPLAVSWANRTELIKASEVKGQFGLTFDLAQLFRKAINN